MAMSWHFCSCASAWAWGMSLIAASSRFLTSALSLLPRASSKAPNGTVTEGGSLMLSGSLPRSPALANSHEQARLALHTRTNGRSSV